jgi:OOP family OmpA-OmpF porin
MMKITHTFSALAFACCVLPSIAMAQSADAASGWYLGGSAGSSTLKLNTGNIVANGQHDTRDTGYKLMGGYKFSNNWATELQYFDLGRYSYTEGRDRLTIGMKGLSVSGVGMWPVNEQVTLLGKLGLAQHVSDARLSYNGTELLTEKTTRTTPLLGVGAEFHINKALRVRAEYEHFGSPKVLTAGNQNLKMRTDLLSVGLLYQF